MDFAPSPQALAHRLQDFLVTRVRQAEQEYDPHRAAAGPNDHTVPPVVEGLKSEARAPGLRNHFLLDVPPPPPREDVRCWNSPSR